MVTGNGDFRYPPPPAGTHDIPSRRRIPNPPRLDPLRLNPPFPRPSTADGLRPPPQRPPPVPKSPRLHHAYPPQADPARRAVSPQPRDDDDDFVPRRPTCRTPTFPATPNDRPRYPAKAGDFEHPPPRRIPPGAPGLRISMSTSKLHNRRPRPPRSRERQPDDLYGLALPRAPPPGSYADGHGEDELRSSVNSAMTSRSSIEHASGTERSSVLTKSSSITDMSPDTPDGPFEKDGGMSVEDAISMYLDGFSDVTEEPGSPSLYGDSKRPWSPCPPTEYTMDGHTSDEHSPDLDPTEDLPPVPPLPELDPPEPRPIEGPPESEDMPDQPWNDLSSLKSPAHSEFQRRDQSTTVVIPGAVPPPLLPGTSTRDCYGFRKATHHVTLEQYEAWHRTYVGFAATRRTKWVELLRENRLPVTDPSSFPPKSNKIKKLVRKGIPPEYRGAAWFFYAGGYEHLNRNPGLYEQLVQQSMMSPTNDDKEHIERDLHRTFPDNIHFKPESADQLGAGASAGSSNLKHGHGSVIVETQMIQSLRRVLYAFAIHNPQIGYTQSLNFITGMLLLFLPEEKAFWMLHIISSVYLPSTHEISLEGANIDLWILMVLLKEISPHVYNKIAGSGFGGNSRAPALTVTSRLPDITLGLTNWLMSVFIGTLPLETTLRVWDAFFYEGSKTFFRVSLAIFKSCEREIMAVSDPMEVFQVVQSVPKKLLDANALLDDCFVRRHRVGQGRIDELRAARRAAVRHENMRRSRAWNKGQIQAATDEWPGRSRTPIPGIERGIAGSWRHMKQHAFR
ncbi:GTPase activating protein [Aspergillus heteromorphus CBS 117.55]|uniref:GTPase activating protein n=1 Tax=Aspergillus heteromorphus CBS 117.55 TaxID=1448321 RepID=A0A317X650_9EURO|nr:GTPase activating protein [Aspergillus heteromorphus CBS 117.55]PWY92050.1 GTPase activating protein [Aspergillus heteromorphus CBS 117.55]